MRFFEVSKDGGPDSPVDALFIIEIKWLFSIVFLKFNKGHREEFHSHAFNALTWFFGGDMVEEDVDGTFKEYRKSVFPKITPRDKFHRVIANKDSYAFTLRGPWCNIWKEYNREKDETVFLTHGRREVGGVSGLV